MIFGMFGRKNAPEDDDDDEGEEEERELVAFQGALNGKPVDMTANSRLAQAALVPAKIVVTDAIERRSEMVRIDIKGERGTQTLYIDGMAYAGEKMPKAQAVAVMQMLKLLAGLDIKLRGQAQSGGMKGEFQGQAYELIVETTPQPDGTERLTLKQRNLKTAKTTLDELGFPASTKALIREKASLKRGIMLIAGPASSGLTTTTYACVKGIDLFIYSVMTTVPMGTREVYNVQKFEQNEGDTAVDTMERMIRAEGHVVFVEPVKSAETAKAMVTVSDRIATLAEMSAKDCANAIVQFREWSGDPAKFAELFELALSPKLIRTLCPACKEAFRPNAKLLQKVGLPPETKALYRKPEPQPDEKTGELPDPCEKCDGVGYIGRAPMVEIITGSEAIRKLIAEGATAEAIRAQARAEGMTTFAKDGLRVVAEGKTSLEELQRLFKA